MPAYLLLATPDGYNGGSQIVNQNSPAMRRILSEWKMVQSQGLALGEGMDTAKGNSTDTFRLKVIPILALFILSMQILHENHETCVMYMLGFISGTACYIEIAMMMHLSYLRPSFTQPARSWLHTGPL